SWRGMIGRKWQGRGSASEAGEVRRGCLILLQVALASLPEGLHRQAGATLSVIRIFPGRRPSS
ncbi:MAG TPA: hypothetical protein VF243_01550, partial [Nitrosospira sp.]